MTASLSVAPDSIPGQTQPVPLAPTRAPLEVHNAPFDDARWDAWVTKGRLANAAFAEKMRTLAMLGGVVVATVGVAWILLG